MSSLLDSVRRLVRNRQDIAANVRLNRSVAHGHRATRLTIDHVIPSARSGRQGRWRITTVHHPLAPPQFDRVACSVINSASERRGRAIFCFDLVRQEVIAAVAYHLDDDPKVPVIVTAFAFRADGDDTFYRESLSAALVLKAYLHALGAKDKRGSEVGYEAGKDTEIQLAVTALAFRRSAAPNGYRAGGTYLAQGPF